MSDSFVLPMMTLLQPALAGEAPPEEEGDATSDFSLEEALSDQTATDAVILDVPVLVQQPQDRLQTLIEDLSGISGALREALPHDGEAEDLSESRLEMPQPGAQSALLALPADAPAVVPVQDEAAMPDRDPLLANPPPALADAVRESAVVDPDPATSVDQVAGTMREAAVGPLERPVAKVQAIPGAPRITDDVVTTGDDGIKVAYPVRDSAVVAPEWPITKVQVVPVARRITEDVVTTREDGVEMAHTVRGSAGVVPERPIARIPVVPVARQIAEAMVTARDDRIEVALAPEELGRIRLVMTGPEHSPHVMIWAERPEILDQLRRNTSFLQECFGEAGMADASFEFQGDSSSGSGGRQPMAGGSQHGFDMIDPVPVPVAWTPMAISARLDIRI